MYIFGLLIFLMHTEKSFLIPCPALWDWKAFSVCLFTFFNFYLDLYIPFLFTLFYIFPFRTFILFIFLLEMNSVSFFRDNLLFPYTYLDFL